MNTRDPVRQAGGMARRLRRRLGSALFLRSFLAVFGIAAFFAGGAILAIRIFAGTWPAAVWVGIAAAAFAVSAACGFIYALKHLPDGRKLLVWLDCTGGSGGVLASSLEVEPGAWREGIVLPEMPKIRIGGRRNCIPAAAGAAFLAGALLVPQSRITPRVHHALDISEETAGLEQKLEVLEEESLMQEKELTEMRAGLEELETNNDARDSARTYELLDALSRKIDLAGEEAGGRAQEKLETLRMLSTALDSLSSLPLDQVPPEAAAQMGELLRQMALENPELADMLAKAGAMASKLDPETMKRLAEAMRDSSGRFEKQLAKLVQQKLMKSRCARPGKCSGKDGSCGSPGACPSEGDLASWLAKNAPGADGLLAAYMMCSGAGNGGVSRGRGDAMLTFTGVTPDFTGKEKDIAVAGENDPAQSMVVQRFAAAPNVDEKERRAAAAGSLRGGEAEIEQRDARIYPEHRSAVERYFKPKEKR